MQQTDTFLFRGSASVVAKCGQNPAHSVGESRKAGKRMVDVFWRAYLACPIWPVGVRLSLSGLPSAFAGFGRRSVAGAFERIRRTVE